MMSKIQSNNTFSNWDPKPTEISSSWQCDTLTTVIAFKVLNDIKELIKTSPNDMELGGKIRQLWNELVEDDKKRL